MKEAVYFMRDRVPDLEDDLLRLLLDGHDACIIQPRLPWLKRRRKRREIDH